MQGKEVVAWGAGKYLSEFSSLYNLNIAQYISYIVDKNSASFNKRKNMAGIEVTITSPDYFLNNVHENTVLLISVNDWYSVYDIVRNEPKLNDIEVYPLEVISRMERERLTYLPTYAEKRLNDTPQIPKVIHYIWFGGKTMPDKFKPYIESWHKFCPDYEIKFWNEDNYDVTSHRFMREAMKQNRPGFAADYARLDIIYKYGGIYLDVDVELLKNLDGLLYNEAFCGFCYYNELGFGLGFGAKIRHPMLEILRSSYDNINIEFNEDKTPIASPYYQTKLFGSMGLKFNGKFQIINGMSVYPAEFFDPVHILGNSYITNNSYSVHHYGGSCVTETESKIIRGGVESAKFVLQSEKRRQAKERIL
jgi:mannosyltransferase OCH1-like enzyme